MDTPFHCIDFDFSHADWNGLLDLQKDAQWEDIFKLGASAAASEFSKRVQVGIDVYIHHSKYWVKFHSFPRFSAASAGSQL